MDRKLFEILDEKAPKFNPIVANGLAVEHMRMAEQYIDRIFRCAETGFPEGLKYLGSQRCTPAEQYAEIIRKRNSRRYYEIAHSDIYMMKYLFEFEGEEIKRYLFLPYVKDGGLITLRGSTFAISPVLTDKAISVGDNSIFIPLTMAKLKFERSIQHFYKDGQRETVYVVWSSLYNRSAKSLRTEGRPKIRAHTTLMHYLFCKVGVTRTFAEYGNADVLVGTSEINEQTYPKEKWIICSSMQLKPRRLRDKYYKGSDIRLAIPREQYNAKTASMIGGFFYVVDHFPERIVPDYVDSTRLWKILMGHLIFSGGISEGKLAEDIETHLESLDGYLDEMAKESLREDGVYCEDLYDLFDHIVETFSERVTQAGNSISSMYGKRLTVLRYVLFDITSAIFTFMFRMRNNNRKQLTKKMVVDAMNFILKPDLIMRINHRHGEVNSISSPGDNKIFKITSNLVLQTDSSGPRGRTRATVTDPTRWLHASVAEVGSYGNLPKSEPSGKGRINPYVNITPDGLIVRKEEYRELLDNIQTKIQR